RRRSATGRRAPPSRPTARRSSWATWSRRTCRCSPSTAAGSRKSPASRSTGARRLCAPRRNNADVRLGSRTIYYGWVIVAALSVTETVSLGRIHDGFPVFLRPMEQDLGASRVAVTAAFSIGLGVSALTSISVGRWLDARGPRALMTAGSVLATALTFAWARVESLPALYAVWSLMGLAMAATLYEPAFAVVVSWFARGRDRALLTVTLVAGLASTIFMPIEAALLELLGWRRALTILAVILGVITIPIHALLLRQGTAHASASAEDGAPAPSLTLAQAAAVFVGQALGIAQLPLLARVGTLVPFIVLQGAANGMATLARASSLAEIFGARNYGTISGAVALGSNAARAVGPVGASLLLLGLGSYPAVFWALAASLITAAGAVVLADRSSRAEG